MPPKPLFQSATTRSAVIAVVMFVALACALAAGALLTGHETVRVGEAAFDVPRRWERIELPAQRGVAAHAVYRPSHDAGLYALEVIEFAGDASRSPQAVLHQTLLLTRESRVRISESRREPIRIGPLMGLRYEGVRHIDLGRAGGEMRYEQIAVLTQDLRRYWVIRFNEAARSLPRSLGELPVNSEVFEQLVSSFRVAPLQPAGPAELSRVAAGLALPDGLQAWVRPGHGRFDPVYLLPTAKDAELGVVRVLGQTGVGDIAHDATLSPGSMFRTLALQVLHREPNDEAGELAESTLGAARVWSLDLVYAGQGLARKVWYAQLADGRSLLVDALAEPRAVHTFTPMAEQLIRSAAGDGQPPAVSPVAIAQAVDRGAAVAQAQRELQLNRLATERFGYMMEFSGQPVGTIVESVTRRDNPARAGEALFTGEGVITRPGGRRVMKKQWSAQSDGAFEMLLSRLLNEETLVEERLTLRDGRLSMTETHNEQRVSHWHMTATPSYLLPLDDRYWPIAALRSAADHDAVVWVQCSTMPPLPCFVEVLDPGDAGRPLRVRLRPMVSVDGDELEIDADGTLRAYHKHEWSTDTRVTLRPATVDEVERSGLGLEPEPPDDGSVPTEDGVGDESGPAEPGAAEER